MKISRHYRAFMEKHGYLELPSLGRFESVHDDISEPIGIKRRITFSFNRKASIDISLVKFLCEQLKKETSVINADLQSFSSTVRELLLQGLEAEIPGIGFLNIASQNQVIFSHHSCYNELPPPKSRKPAPAIMNMSFWM